MSDLFDRVTADQDIFKKLFSKIPGFSGYIERQNRRASDKLLREAVAARYEESYQKISGLQRDLIAGGEIGLIDDLEAAALKLRQFIDRIRTAAYGYSGFFDAVKIKGEELNQVYQYDLAMLNAADEVKHAVENVETSIGSDGLPAAIRNLTSLAQQSVEIFNRRSEVMIGGVEKSQ